MNNKHRTSNLFKATLPLAAMMAAPQGMASTRSVSRRIQSNAITVEAVSSKVIDPVEISDDGQRSVFAAFGGGGSVADGDVSAESAGYAKPGDAKSPEAAMAFLKANGLLDAKSAGSVAATNSGDIDGRKIFASDSPYNHCHFPSGWGTYYTNTSAGLTETSCVTSWGGTWHTATTAPVVMTTSVQNKTSTSFDVAVTMSEASTLYAVLVASSSPAPTPAQVMAGLDGNGNAALQTQSGAAANSATLSFTGLSSSTSYMVYLAAEDGSSEVTSSSTQVNPAFETGLITGVDTWKFPKVRVDSTGTFWLGHPLNNGSGDTIYFKTWNGAGFSTITSFSAADLAGRTYVSWGNEGRVDFEIDTNGYIHVVFNATETNMANTGDPFYGVYNGSSWTFTNIGETGGSVDEIDLFLDSNGKAHVSWQDNNSGLSGDEIVYATNTSGSWSMTTVVTAADDGTDELHDSYVVVSSTGVATVVYRREDLQNNGQDNYYLESSSDSFASATKILDGKTDTKQYRLANLLIDSSDKLHYAWSNDTDNRSYYTTNASGSWVSTEIDHASHTGQIVYGFEEEGGVYYFASYGDGKYFMNSFDGTTWIDGFDFTLDGWMNDRFAISDTADRVMYVSENSSDWEIHYHTGTIAGYITPPVSSDSDGSLTASATVTEPVGLGSTVDTVGEAVDVFDFTLSDGGGGDALAMEISQIVVNVSGTSTDTERGQISWRLNGPDAANVTGSYSAGADTITFSGLGVSIADGASETYTVNAYYNDNSNLTEDHTFILSVDGDTDVTISSGTNMGTTSAVTNSTGGTVDIVASQLAFTTQPAGSVSGSALTTQPVVTAQDAFGNTDVDFTETVTLTEASAGTLTSATAVASSGVATFSGLIYTATADQQSFTLTANDQDGVGTDLSTVNANSVTSDVVATALQFSTQPAPLSVQNGVATSFTTVPVVQAVDGNGTVDTGYSTGMTLAEVNGAGSATMTGTGDTDGSGATVTLTPSSGVATYSGLSVTYTNSGAGSEAFNLQASSGGLTTATSSQITATSTPTVSDGNISISGASGSGGAFVIGDTVTVSWNNSAGGDNNSGVTGVTVDFSQFGGGSAVTASESAGTWTASYTIVAGSIDATNRNVSVTASNTDGPTTTADTTNATVDNIAPTVTDGNLAISGASGTGGAFIIGDTVTVTWNNTAGGDNNTDTISSATVDFSAFGGGSAVTASNSSGTWTATYTLVSGAIDSTNLNVSLTATDNAGNTTTTADSSNAVVDNIVPTVTDGNLGLSGASGSLSTFIVGDTVTASWNNSSAGDNNTDTISSVSFNFTAFGGGSAVAASNSGDSWTATYTLSEGSANGSNLNVAATVMDNAGNTTTTADTSNVNADTNTPSGHSVSFDDSLIGTGENTSASFTFAGAEVGASYSYSISSSGGGTPVTGSGTLATTTDQITGLDLSGLGDGTLTLSVTLTDAAGNSATAVTATTMLDIADPAISSSVPADNATDVQYNAAIQLTLTEAVVAASGSFHLYNATGSTLVESIAVGSSQVVVSGSGVTITPSANFTPTNSYYLLADSGLLVDSAGNGFADLANATELNFTVANNNPTGSADSGTTLEDNAVTIDVLANDGDVDSALNAASVTVTNAPANGTTSVNTASGAITYSPALNFNGTDSFTYSVDDIHSGNSGDITVNVTITAENDAPVAVADLANTAEDTAVTVDVAANDTDVDSGDSVDATTLAIVTQPSNGSATVVNGEIQYTPALNFNGSDTLTYSIEDQNGATSAAGTLIINISGVNDAPVAAADSGSTDEDTAVTLDVLTNDSDIDGTLDATQVTLMAQPANGTATVDAASGEISYTPAADFNGSDSFSYVVQDDGGATSNVATVTLTVNAVNDAPRLVNDSVTLLEDASHNINALGNDSDVDGIIAVASLEVVDQPVSGTVSISAGVITYTPTTDFNGSDSLTYRVQDDLGAWSETATVTISVTAVNDEPLANDDSATTNEDTAVIIDLAANDSDIDGSLDLTSIEIITDVANGALVDNADGTVSYTPANDFNGADSFVYQISDNEAGTSDTALVTITVNAVNDAPVISGTPAGTVLEGATFSFTPTVTDVDSTGFSYSLSGQPDWMSINTSTGAVTGSPAVGDEGSYSGIVITVDDGASDNSSSTLAAFTLVVEGDFDTDGIPNTTDTDDDNDGMPDDYEITYGFDPYDDSDALADSDGDTIPNGQEQQDGTDPTNISEYLDVTPPVITPPADAVVDATGVFTRVVLADLLGDISDINSLTTDNVDGAGCCSTQVEGMRRDMLRMRPGLHTITYTATDAKGNVATATQSLRVRPLVSFSRDVAGVEGGTAVVKVILNGSAPDYPFEVPFMIDSTGSASSDDHDLSDGSVIFATGETERSISINLVDDGISEGTESLVIRLDDDTSDSEDLSAGFDPSNPDIHDINAGAENSVTVSIGETNLPPESRLALNQNGASTIQVTTDNGPVTATVSVTDPNLQDTHSYNWSASDSTLVDTDGSLTNTTLVFDPSGMAAGRYLVQVQVTDSAGNADISRLHFLVVAALPTLDALTDSDGDGIDDAQEGTADSDDDGIPDYLDNIAATNMLPEVASETDGFLLECDPGVRCRLGQFALLGDSGGARLDEDELDSQSDLGSDPLFQPSSGIFDFEIQDLPTMGQSVSVVIPQTSPIPESAVYRKFQNGQWSDFVVNENNLIHSAEGELGYCPPPGDSSWSLGMTAGHYCIQLTIEDGGPNDADGMVNAAVEDPGAVSVLRADQQQNLDAEVKSDSRNGAGSMDWIALLGLGGLVTASVLARRQRNVTRHSGQQFWSLAAMLGTSTGTALLALALLTSATPVMADNHGAGEFKAQKYLFVSLGRGQSSLSGSEVQENLQGDGVAVEVGDYRAKRGTINIGLGYQYARDLALELSYLDMGDATARISGNAIPNEVKPALREHFAVGGSGVMLAHKIRSDITDRVAINLVAGLYRWTGQVESSNPDLRVNLQGGYAPVLGLGLDYAVDSHYRFGSEVKRLMFEDQQLDIWAIKMDMMF